MRNLKDYTEGALAKAISFARERKDPSLVKCLKNLRVVHNKGYAYEEGYTEIYQDFAPYSFYFVRYTRGCVRFMNGGIIFHGKHDNGGDGSAPTFSVSLTPCDGWQIHT
jgi:hypothetical protein